MTNQDKMVAAFKERFGDAQASLQQIALPPFQSGFQAAYQLQQTKLDKAVKALEVAEKIIGDGKGYRNAYASIRQALAEIKERKI